MNDIYTILSSALIILCCLCCKYQDADVTFLSTFETAVLLHVAATLSHVGSS